MKSNTTSMNSLAVLRFTDMSSDKDQVAFCDGIAEEILSRLTEVQDLSVTARTSSFLFDNDNLSIREIGQRLGVRHVLEGSVKFAGNQIRVTTQLIESQTEFLRWSRRYTRKLGDFFNIYDDVALDVVRELATILGCSESPSERGDSSSQLANLILNICDTPVLGLDIGATSVKLVELSMSGDKYTVERYAVEPLPLDAIVDHQITDVDAVGRAIDQAVVRSGTTLRDAAVALDGSAVTTRAVAMPAEMSKDERMREIRQAHHEYIPLPLDEISLGCEVQHVVPDDEDQVEVLVAACGRELVETVVSTVKLGKLSVNSLATDTLSLQSVYQIVAASLDSGPDQVVALFDCGGTLTGFTVFAASGVCWERKLLFGGRQLSEELQRRYLLTPEEAMQGLKQGTLPDDCEAEVLLPFKEAVAGLAVKSLNAFYSQCDCDVVDHILVTGGSASLPGLGDVLAQQSGVATTIVNPFASMEIADAVDASALAQDGPALTIACGLALRGFEQNRP